MQKVKSELIYRQMYLHQIYKELLYDLKGNSLKQNQKSGIV